MVSDRDPLEGLPRQAHPIGDVEQGQVVQTVSTFPTTEVVPDWTKSKDLTVSSSVVQLDQALRLSNNYCFITIETATIRYWPDGTVPSATSVHELDAGDTLTLETADELQDIQFIRRDGTDATLRCSFGNRK